MNTTMATVVEKTFEISSGKIIITSPNDSKEITSGEMRGIRGGPKETHTKCVIDNVLCGKWTNRMLNDDKSYITNNI